MSLKPFDYEMIRYAMRRGPVIVNVGGVKRTARLWSWRPRHNGKHTDKARIQYPSGRFAHVKIDQLGLEGIINEQ